MKEKLKKFNILRNIFKIVSIVGISFFGFYVLIKIFGIEILDLESFVPLLARAYPEECKNAKLKADKNTNKLVKK